MNVTKRRNHFVPLIFASVCAGMFALGGSAQQPDDEVDARIRASFPEFFPDGVRHSIPLNEIAHGGPPKDGIPALTKPKTVPGANADFLSATDRVIGVVVNGKSRAYPIKIMNWHEIVNDDLGGRRITVTFCPLCGTGIVFDATVDGRTMEFGVSGLLHNSDLLMYDRHTDAPSLWQQALGRAVVGPATDTRLRILPAVHTQWAKWFENHPDTAVVSIDTGFERPYNRDLYDGYEDTDAVWFAVNGDRPDLPRKAWVFGLIVNGQIRAYPLDLMVEARVVNDRLGGTNIVLIADDTEPPAVRAYARGDEKFIIRDEALIDATGREWTFGEEAIVGPDGVSHPRQEEGFTAFWFAWSVFYPRTTVYDGKLSVDPTRSKLERWGRLKQDSTNRDGGDKE